MTTAGEGSQDRYGDELARHLGAARLDLGLAGSSAGLWGVDAAAPAALRALARDVALIRRLRAQPGLLHLTNHHLGRYALALRRPYAITAHDLIRYFDATHGTGHISVPGRRDRRMIRADYRGVARAALVIVPSHAARRDVIEHLGVLPGRVAVVPLGIDHARFRPTARRLVEGRHVLFVGSEHPRKDLPTLLRAFARLRRERGFGDLRLVKVGAPGSGEADFGASAARLVRELGIARHVVFTGAVPDEDLPAYYSGASCLVLPSLAEGFGIPPLEAMACGCPVIVTAAGSLPEVAGPAARVVAPRDSRALARAMAEVLGDPGAAADLRARGLAHAHAFTWERTARETAAALARIAPRA